MNPKIIAFIQAVAVAMLFAGLDAVASNIGASGLVSGTVATIVVGVIGILENSLNNHGSKALLGMVSVA